MEQQVFLSYHRTKKQLSTPLKQKHQQNGEKKHSRKPYILLAPLLLNTKTLSIRTDSHEGDTSRRLKEVRSQMVLLELSIYCIFDPD